MGALTAVMLQLLLLLSSPWYCAAVAADGDAEALLGFLSGIDKDPSGALTKSWMRGNVDAHGCPSGWQGISCDAKGRVVTLDLGGLALSGRIKAGTLGRLASLTLLSLRNNMLSGSIPGDLGDLQQLQQLDLSNNMLSGSILPTLAGLTSLVNLSIAGNGLGGAIPDGLFRSMPSLLQLDLSRNVLSAGIPSSLTSLKKLSQLDLSSNQLTGSVPSRLDTLASLEVLDLHGNRLTGAISASWLSLESIARVDLSRNDLSGQLPWLGSLLPPNLLHVNLSYNRLSGPLAPENAANLFASKLQVLDASSNSLSGALPSFEFVFSLTALKLNRNLFTGFVPPALLSADASLLEELDLSQNRLSGNVWAISAPRLSMLNLSSNLLSGMLPPRLGSCASVDLSNNMFTGGVAAMKTWGNYLESINLSNNSLEGALPNETAQLLRLTSLSLSHNKLSGAIPPSFGSFPKLTNLDMRGNSFTSAIPSSFFFSASMASLSLSGNQLTGGIPFDDSRAGAVSPLRLLDLSANELSGAIPTKLATITTLQVLDLSRNRLTGQIPLELKQLQSLEQLDLSANLLVGSIPTELPPRMHDLSLSNNNLSGEIPPQLERQFPPSSFYPGNVQLQSHGFRSWSGSPQANEPKGLASSSKDGRSSRSSSLKAGIIAACCVAVILPLLIGLFLYYRRTARAKEKSAIPVFRVVERDILRPATPTPSPAAAPPTQSAKAGALVQDTGKAFLPSLKAPASDSSMKPNSPEKLAGDLFLLDHDVVFTAEELSRAPAEVLGRSGQGTSYKATLDSGHTIAVKWLKEGLAKSKREFTTEAKRFGAIRHNNLLPLRGYYWGPREHEKLLLTDFMAQGSLADRLNDRSSRQQPPLTWLQRLRVAAGVARGLSYLHDEHKMAHGNLKASNVLLDGPELDARLSDYGHHRLMTTSGTASQILNAGALGYRAPELSAMKKPKPTLGSDIYAYGVLLLEMLTGKSAADIVSGNSDAVDLTDWVRLLVADNREGECLDPILQSTTSQAGGPQQLLQLALKCTSETAQRPSIANVCNELQATIATSNV